MVGRAAWGVGKGPEAAGEREAKEAGGGEEAEGDAGAVAEEVEAIAEVEAVTEGVLGEFDCDGEWDGEDEGIACAGEEGEEEGGAEEEERVEDGAEVGDFCFDAENDATLVREFSEWGRVLDGRGGGRRGRGRRLGGRGWVGGGKGMGGGWGWELWLGDPVRVGRLAGGRAGEPEGVGEKWPEVTPWAREGDLGGEEGPGACGDEEAWGVE